MASSFDIREYESFVDASVLNMRGIAAGDGFVAMEHEAFEALESFILESRDAGAEPLELMSLGAKRGVGKTITARNYVGAIVLTNGTTIQILPKLIVGGSAEDERRVFLRMLQSVMDLPMKEFDLARLASAKTGVLEPFITMFSKAACDLAKRGLRGAYVAREGNERFLKGKVDFAQNLKVNAVHAERVYVRYDEFGVNRPENRLIKTALELLRGKTRSLSTRRDIDTTLLLFADVEISNDIERDFTRCQLDRTMGAYGPLLKWCRVFLKGESFTSFKGSHVAYSLLFPMETLFEAYVAWEVRKAAAAVGWRATAQDKGMYLYDRPKRFRLRPDIVLRRADARPIVMDTKWKRIGGAANDGASQADMYQMYAYQHKYGASKSVLVYPRHDRLEAGLREGYASVVNGHSDALTQVFVFDLKDAAASANALVELAIADGSVL